ncbi:MAG: recombinase family protein [Vulcanimicrobiaceae bacterium]
MTAAIYVRVSTQDQKHDMQLTELRAYAKRMKWKVVIYAEKESSVVLRPVLDRMMEDARLHKFEVVLVWKLDRFGRSLSHLLTLIQSLEAYGIRFIASTQGIDTDKSNPMAKLMLHMIGAFAEFERAIIVERVRAGVAEAKRQGIHCGRPWRIFSRDRAIEMKQSGLSYRKIGKELGVSYSTVMRALEVVQKSGANAARKARPSKRFNSRKS